MRKQAVARWTRTVGVLLMLLSVLPLGSGVLAGEAPEFGKSAEEKAVCELTNEERRKAGLESLLPNRKLFEAARAHAGNMAKHNKMTHKLDGKDVAARVEARGYRYFLVGENVASGQETPDAAMASWMRSSGHRANILRREFTEIGVGVAHNDEGEPYYVQNFGRPAVFLPADGEAGQGRAASRPSGAPAGQATITVLNETERSAKVMLPGSDKSTKLEGGARGTFTLSGLDEFPPAKVRVGKVTAELKMEDGARYVIRPAGDGFEITREQHGGAR